MTTKLEQVARQALEALEVSTDWDICAKGKQLQSMKAITALREVFAQPQVSDYDREFWGDGQPQENTARCGGCNKTAEDGWALYCVECWEKAQPQDNLNCKSVQARLATSWGYVLPEDNTK